MSVFGRMKAAVKATAEDKNKDEDLIENEDDIDQAEGDDEAGDETEKDEADQAEGDEETDDDMDPEDEEKTPAEKKAFRRGAAHAHKAACEILDLCALAGKSSSAHRFIKAGTPPSQVRVQLLKQTATPSGKKAQAQHSGNAPKANVLSEATKNYYANKKGK